MTKKYAMTATEVMEVIPNRYPIMFIDYVDEISENSIEYCFCAFLRRLDGVSEIVTEESIRNKKDFSMKKATEGIKLFMFYVITVFFIFAVLHRNVEFANEVVNWLTYIVCYFFTTNIFRNAKICFPNSKSISFLYHLLSTEIFVGIKKLISQKIGINIDEKDDKQN